MGELEVAIAEQSGNCAILVLSSWLNSCFVVVVVAVVVVVEAERVAR